MKIEHQVTIFLVSDAERDPLQAALSIAQIVCKEAVQKQSLGKLLPRTGVCHLPQAAELRDWLEPFAKKL